MVHEDLITQHATHVRKICLEDKSDSDFKDFDRTEIPAWPVRYYLDWLYSSRKDLSWVVERGYSPAVPMCKEEKGEIFVYLWLLGNDFGDSRFQNLVMDHLQEIQFMQKEKTENRCDTAHYPINEVSIGSATLGHGPHDRD